MNTIKYFFILSAIISVGFSAPDDFIGEAPFNRGISLVNGPTLELREGNDSRLSRRGSSSGASDSEGYEILVPTLPEEEGPANILPLAFHPHNPLFPEDFLIAKTTHLLVAGQDHLSDPEKEFVQSSRNLAEHKRTLVSFLKAQGRKYPLATPYFEALAHHVRHNEGSYRFEKDRLVEALHHHHIPADVLHRIKTVMGDLEERCKENVQSIAHHTTNRHLRTRQKLASHGSVHQGLNELHHQRFLRF
ncbi:MAG: hypothetical protein A2621_01635 [Alphaproteobacteria bacterium RIFCSPHIGHO2_01_FULL_41_14]|nr:MAG: hypothetical protein A2065_01690 [Alphaproteobacteria bacterium GWB1_45_5]OFW89598.1 MAG: hypothetical protein A2621_01635 [Alphaproteobacteria bacterium RIFCSPHIGHO2_01_FULL_41_14]HCI48490.1 hypothetical protein [Holosporales bacterium]